MVCEADEPDVDIGIPVVMLPQDAGESLKESFQKNLNGKSHCVFCYNCYEMTKTLLKQLKIEW